MRTYSAPDFNLMCNVWRQEISSDLSNLPNRPPTRTRDYQTICQLYLSQKSGGEYLTPTLSNNLWFPSVGQRLLLRVPALTPMSAPVPYAFADSMWDAVEVPSGSGYYYAIVGVFDAHLGFTNAYRSAVLVPYLRYGTPDDQLRRQDLIFDGAGEGDLGP